MNSGTVLRDVNETLRQLLKTNIPEFTDDNGITFDSPGDVEVSNTPRLSVFLYQVAENPHLRNNEREYTVGTNNQMAYPPVTLDLYYLITPYAQNRETELIILERLIQLFYDQAGLEGPVLQGNLAATGNNKLRIVPHNLALEELHRLWEGFPNKPFKLSLSYLVTPVKIPSGRVETVPTVAKRKIILHHGSGTEERLL